MHELPAMPHRTGVRFILLTSLQELIGATLRAKTCFRYRSMSCVPIGRRALPFPADNRSTLVASVPGATYLRGRPRPQAAQSNHGQADHIRPYPRHGERSE